MAPSYDEVVSGLTGAGAPFEIVEFTEAPLPRNPAGKLLKNALRGSGAVPFDSNGRG